jgi:hypothetical protein
MATNEQVTWFRNQAAARFRTEFTVGEARSFIENVEDLQELMSDNLYAHYRDMTYEGLVQESVALREEPAAYAKARDLAMLVYERSHGLPASKLHPFAE